MNTWIFQGKPEDFDMERYVEAEQILWSVRQEHLAPKMLVGDRVYLWRAIGAGPRDRSGIVAAGTITEPPRFRDDDDRARALAHNPEVVAARLRVAIRIDADDGAGLLCRDALAQDPILGELPILKNPRGTNFFVSDAEQAARLKASWDAVAREQPSALRKT